MGHTIHLHLKGGSVRTLQVEEGANLLEHLRAAGYYVRSSCGGYASCSDCIVKILDGKNGLNNPTFEETQLLGNVYHITSERLACQTFVSGEAAVDLSSHDEEEDQNRLQNKKKSQPPSRVKRRKQSEWTQIKKEREEKGQERQKEESTWHQHWKDKDRKAGEKRFSGGRKRPKAFQTPDPEPASQEGRSDFQKEREDSQEKKD